MCVCERERTRAFVRGFWRGAVAEFFRFCGRELSLSLLSLPPNKARGKFEPFSECTFGRNARDCDAWIAFQTRRTRCWMRFSRDVALRALKRVSRGTSRAWISFDFSPRLVSPLRRALLCVFLSRLLTESLSSSSSFNDDRLYVRGVILGYKRARTNQYENTSLIKLENVPDKSSTAFYLGKKLCYVYKAHTKKQGTVYRTMWGKVTRAHGTSGVVRAQFKHNLPPSSIGGKIRCMLYPSNI
jgi:large subunit ribosomal protein L35Ae